MPFVEERTNEKCHACDQPATGIAGGPPHSRKPCCNWHTPKNGENVYYKPIASLVEKFYINVRGHHWEIECPICRSRWSLERPDPGSDVKIGSILHLLNHAASHESKKKRA